MVVSTQFLTRAVAAVERVLASDVATEATTARNTLRNVAGAVDRTLANHERRGWTITGYDYARTGIAHLDQAVAASTPEGVVQSALIALRHLRLAAG